MQIDWIKSKKFNGKEKISPRAKKSKYPLLRWKEIRIGKKTIKRERQFNS